MNEDFFESLHNTVGCCGYWYNGYWYGRKKGKNTFSTQLRGFKPGDKVEVYFDVDNWKVKFYLNSELVINCKTSSGRKIQKGLRIAVVLGFDQSEGAIVSYERISDFPSEKIKDIYVQPNP